MANSDITSQIMQALRGYTDEVKEEVDKAAEEVSKQAADKLKSTSPKKTGKYAAGWTTKKVGDKWIVHNKKRYQLTHLLEKGHAKVNGGRVSAQVHIRPVEQEAIEEFVERIERAVRGN